MGPDMKLDFPRRAALLGIALALCVGGAQAQVYKWRDAKGAVHYGDQPPRGQPGLARLPDAVADGAPAALPYELARAARNSPVTLYSTANCGACEAGRALLRQRGVPFAEKTVSSDADRQQLKQAGSDGQVPLLLVGRGKLVGFATDAWNDALSAAAYPAQSMLPSGYRNRAAEAAAPAATQREAAPPAARATAQAEAAAEVRPRKSAPPKTHSDFQF